MQTKQNGIKANNSSLIQRIKSLFQGNAVTETPVYTHPTYLNRNKCVTINVNELSPKAKQSFDQLFDRVFANVQPLRN